MHDIQCTGHLKLLLQFKYVTSKCQCHISGYYSEHKSKITPSELHIYLINLIYQTTDIHTKIHIHHSAAILSAFLFTFCIPVLLFSLSIINVRLKKTFNES